jgi:hypothetical protein
MPALTCNALTPRIDGADDERPHVAESVSPAERRRSPQVPRGERRVRQLPMPNNAAASPARENCQVASAQTVSEFAEHLCCAGVACPFKLSVKGERTPVVDRMPTRAMSVRAEKSLETSAD